MLTDIEEQIIRFAQNPERGPDIAVIGGGTGLSTMLRGLKLYSSNLTAIVTVADNGGSSGMLREDLGILPPGDIRNCILALADTEPLMSDLLNYRFTEGRLRGQNFGNLLIAAMNAVSGNFYDAVRNVSKVLAVTGRVLPVSLHDIQISARLADGSIIDGEDAIGHRNPLTQSEIQEIRMQPEGAEPLPEAIEALRSADLIVLGPGSLYTSVIPNLLFPEIVEAIKASHALRIYVCNIMTQPAETYGFDVNRHLDALMHHAHVASANQFIDACVVNDADMPPHLIERYQREQAAPVACDRMALAALGIQAAFAPLVTAPHGVIRHDHTRLARLLMQLLLEHRPSAAETDQHAGRPPRRTPAASQPAIDRPAPGQPPSSLPT